MICRRPGSIGLFDANGYTFFGSLLGYAKVKNQGKKWIGVGRPLELGIKGLKT